MDKRKKNVIKKIFKVLFTGYLIIISVFNIIHLFDFYLGLSFELNMIILISTLLDTIAFSMLLVVFYKKPNLKINKEVKVENEKEKL